MEQSVGKTLRKAREERGAELAEVEATTRIRARFLRAIEDEQWGVLPGEAYVRGFIRTYAAYLGLDGERLAEQHRREVGAARPGERLLGADPTQPRPARKPARRPPVPPRLAAIGVSLGLVAVLLAVGLRSGEEDRPDLPRREPPQLSVEAPQRRSASVPHPASGLSLHLTATDEVWVCLLGAAGQPLVEGRILGPGAEAGPFRSGSFTVSLGNGEVLMTVNGKQASIPATPSPIGYAIGTGGALRELPEGERPTCT